jgi:hypothetical protein
MKASQTLEHRLGKDREDRQLKQTDKGEMLRITIHNTPERTKIELEGRVAGAWVSELNRAWQQLQDIENSSIIVSLCQVTYVDADGKRLLSDMCNAGVSFEASGCLTRSIVEELTGSCPNTSAARHKDSHERKCDGT